MPFTYAVLGAGRQGTAAAYDMARWGDARRVVVADQELAVAQRAAQPLVDRHCKTALGPFKQRPRHIARQQLT